MENATDLRRLLFDKEIDARIKAGQDGIISIMLSENRRLEEKVDSVKEKMVSENRRLEDKVDSVKEKIDSVISMKKWAIGMFVTILLIVAAQALPSIIAMVNQ